MRKDTCAFGILTGDEVHMCREVMEVKQAKS